MTYCLHVCVCEPHNPKPLLGLGSTNAIWLARDECLRVFGNLEDSLLGSNGLSVCLSRRLLSKCAHTHGALS